jgi:hypothetical protein
MFTKTKIALVTALVFGTASAALANDIETNPSEAQSAREWAQYLGQKQQPQNAFASGTYKSLVRRAQKVAGQAKASTVPCPTLEGYPDCH